MNSKGADASQAEGPSEFSRHILSCFWWSRTSHRAQCHTAYNSALSGGLCCSFAKSRPALQPHGLKHARLPCPPLSPRVCSRSSGLYQYVLGRVLHCLHNPKYIYIYVFPLYQKSASLQVFSSASSLAIISDAFVQISRMFLNWTWILIPEICANSGCHVDGRNEAKPMDNYKWCSTMVIHLAFRMLAHPPSLAASPSGSNHSTLLSLHLL